MLIRCLIALLVLVPKAYSEEPIPLDPGVGGMSIGEKALSPGDIIVATTTAKISKRIQKATNSPVSHAMLYAGIIDGKPYVIEAVETGVRRVPLADAFQGASLAVAFRHPKATDAGVKKLLAFANRKVNQKYDKFGIVQQLLCRKGRMLCKVSTQDDTWYCSELIVTAFQEAEMPLALKKPDWKAPGDIANLSITNELEYVGHLLTP